MEEVMDKLKDISIIIMIRQGIFSAGINHSDNQEPRISREGLDITDEKLKEAVEKVKEVISGRE